MNRAIIQKCVTLCGISLASMLGQAASAKAKDPSDNGLFFVTPGSPRPRPIKPAPGQVALSIPKGGSSSGGTITNSGSSVKTGAGNVVTGIVNTYPSLPITTPSTVTNAGKPQAYTSGQVAVSVPSGSGYSSGGSTVNSGSSVNSSKGEIVGGVLKAGVAAGGAGIDAGYSTGLGLRGNVPLSKLNRPATAKFNVPTKKTVSLPRTNARHVARTRPARTPHATHNAHTARQPMARSVAHRGSARR